MTDDRRMGRREGVRRGKRGKETEKKNDFWPSVFSKAFMVGKHLELFWPNNISTMFLKSHLCRGSLFSSGNFQPNSSYFKFGFWGDTGEETQVRHLRSAWLVQESQLCSGSKKQGAWLRPWPPWTPLLPWTAGRHYPRHRAEPSTFICCAHLIMATTCL